MVQILGDIPDQISVTFEVTANTILPIPPPPYVGFVGFTVPRWTFGTQLYQLHSAEFPPRKLALERLVARCLDLPVAVATLVAASILFRPTLYLAGIGESDLDFSFGQFPAVWAYHVRGQ